MYCALKLVNEISLYYDAGRKNIKLCGSVAGRGKCDLPHR
jgi:hypothetical protein